MYIVTIGNRHQIHNGQILMGGFQTKPDSLNLGWDTNNSTGRHTVVLQIFVSLQHINLTYFQQNLELPAWK